MTFRRISPEAAQMASCYILVGRFIYEFNHTEAKLNSAIAAAFEMDTLQGAIFETNVDVARKIAILRSVLPYCRIGEKLVKHYTRYITQFSELNVDRNIVAHYPFGPTEDDGVKFYVIQAKGKLKFPETIWRSADFQNKFAKFHRIYEKLEELTGVIKRNSSSQLLFKALSGPGPTFGSEMPNLRGLLLPPIPDAPGSNQTASSHETDPETSEDPQE